MHVIDNKMKIHAKPIGWLSILYLYITALNTLRNYLKQIGFAI